MKGFIEMSSRNLSDEMLARLGLGFARARPVFLLLCCVCELKAALKGVCAPQTHAGPARGSCYTGSRVLMMWKGGWKRE